MTSGSTDVPIHDSLLSFLSEKGRGTWKDVVDAWDWLEPDKEPAEKAWIVVRDLSSLGHLEVSWLDGDITWSAPQPVITIIPRSGGRAFVSGSRSRELYVPRSPSSGTRPAEQSGGRLLEVATEMDLWVDEIDNVNAPTTLYVACSESSDAKKLADALVINYIFSVASKLSGIFPDLDSYADLWAAGDLPIGFDVEMFNTSILKWVETNTTEELGLYRASTHAKMIYGIHGPAAGTWRRVTPDHAIYEFLRWDERHVINYNPDAQDLAVPYHVGLPILQGRAAVLSSGRLPTARTIETDTGREIYSWTFPNVSEQVAQRIASSLSQPLRKFSE